MMFVIRLFKYRVDDHSGKLMFNIRVESDMPVSKLKGKKKSHGPLLPVRLPGSLDTRKMKPMLIQCVVWKMLLYSTQ